MKWKNKGHEFDETGAMLAHVQQVFLYGIGGNAQELLNVITQGAEWIDWDIRLVDRNVSLQTSGYNGFSVMAPEELYEMPKENYIVIACPLGETGNEIAMLAEVHGIPKHRIFMGDEFLYTYFPVYFLYAHNMVFFTSQNIVPSSACNLNCRDCLNFNPYIKQPTVYNMQELRKSVDLFFQAVDLIYRFQVTGGEPLLYPHLQELLTYIDENYRSKIMRLETVTNGTIIPSDELCEFFAAKDIYVFLDDYTKSLPKEHAEKHDKVLRQFQKYNVKYADNFVEQWFQLYPASEERTGISEEALCKFFDACGNPWSTIEQGKITACNYALYAQKAGLVSYKDEDYYDLSTFEPSKKPELVEFRLRYNQYGYTALCQKCEGFSTINKRWCKPAIQVKRDKELESSV